MNISYNWTKTPSTFRIIYRISDIRTTTHLNDITKKQCFNNFIDIFGTENLTIIADNIQSSKTMDMLSSGVGNDNIITSTLGNAGSLKLAFETAMTYDDTDIIYFVEDDYLHKKNSRAVLLEGLEKANFVSLYDNPDKYLINGPNRLINGGENCKTMLTTSSHWRTTNSTTMTFATRVFNVKIYKSNLYSSCATEQPQDFKMWLEILKNTSLVIPIPGYSTHCHPPWISPLNLWE